MMSLIFLYTIAVIFIVEAVQMAVVPVFKAGESQATRQSSGKVVNALSPVLPTLLGGSADLAPSTLTLIKDAIAIIKERHGIDIDVRSPGSSGGYDTDRRSTTRFSTAPLPRRA